MTDSGIAPVTAGGDGTPASMTLRVRLPFREFLNVAGVRRIVADSVKGAFGILPRRLDCLAALVPGILMYEGADGEERYIAVDEGILVKTGFEVLVSVRSAIGDVPLGEVRQAVARQLAEMDEREVSLRRSINMLQGRIGIVR